MNANDRFTSNIESAGPVLFGGWAPGMASVVRPS